MIPASLTTTSTDKGSTRCQAPRIRGYWMISTSHANSQPFSTREIFFLISDTGIWRSQVTGGLLMKLSLKDNPWRIKEVHLRRKLTKDSTPSIGKTSSCRMIQASTRKFSSSQQEPSNSTRMLTFNSKSRKNKGAKIKEESWILRMRCSKKWKIS